MIERLKQTQVMPVLEIDRPEHNQAITQTNEMKSVTSTGEALPLTIGDLDGNLVNPALMTAIRLYEKAVERYGERNAFVSRYFGEMVSTYLPQVPQTDAA